MIRLRILILEHDPNDIELLQFELKKSDLEYEDVVVSNKETYEQALIEFKPDIILSDYSLPSFDGLTAFKIKKTISPDTPFIVVSGTIGEENATELIKMGITDYVLKDKMYQVILKIRRALNESKERKAKLLSEQKLYESEQKYRQLFQLSPIPKLVYDPQTLMILTVNEAAIRQYGYSSKEFMFLNIKDLYAEEEQFQATAKADLVFIHKKKDDSRFFASIRANTIEFDGKEASLVLATDVTERITYLEAIKEQNRKLQAIAWIQSHKVRAPLSRIMGLIDCLAGDSLCEEEGKQLLSHILMSAKELDGLIRDIVSKSEKVQVDQNL